jgi:1-acyl-sn-glycerol-3-phosphate acyltransferase
LDNVALIRIVKLCLPLYMRFALCDTRLVPVAGAVERFKQVSGKRALICANHSNRHDPQVMYALSRIVGEDFNFIAAREVFDWDNGLNGWWLQHLGCYSVVRGAADRESFKTTKRLLCEGKKKLVLFPEGEISRQNDTLMPLESGAAQMAFWALDDLAKQSPGAPLPEMPIIPLAFKYTYARDIRSSLSNCLRELEARLAIKPESEEQLYMRLRKVAETLLAALEHEYGFKPTGTSLNDRVHTLRGFILENVARQLNVSIPANGRQLESVRVLRNSMDDFIYADEHNGSEYQRKIHEEKSTVLKGLYKDLDRVVNFIAIYDGYLGDHLTQERFSDVLDRLETEILRVREPSFRGPRRILIDVGEPINVSRMYSGYKSEKRATIQKVTEQLFGQISQMLTKMESQCTPLKL